MLFELVGASFRYDDGSAALEDVSLVVDSGEQVVVLGANGSGKSTLLKMLDGLLFPTSGTIRFEGRELSEATLKEPTLRGKFRREVGFVFQNADAQLFNATVREELAFGPLQLGLTAQEVEERVSDTLLFLGIAHLADRPPFRLSGGEKRKVAIGSVLTMNPSVLLFDEPLLGLDPRSQAWFVRTIQQLQQSGKTTVIATHTVEVVKRVATRAILLSEGHRVVADGPLEEVLGDLGVLRGANLIE